jgi:hypothetical protein
MAEEMGAAGRRQVLSRHTHMHRARRLLEALDLLPEGARAAPAD